MIHPCARLHHGSRIQDQKSNLLDPDPSIGGDPRQILDSQRATVEFGGAACDRSPERRRPAKSRAEIPVALALFMLKKIATPARRHR